MDAKVANAKGRATKEYQLEEVRGVKRIYFIKYIIIAYIISYILL